MHRSVCLLFAALAAASSLPTPHAAAEDASAQSTATYDDTIRRALQEFNLSHYSEAKVLFLQAHALKPNARALRGLGLTCYESRQYVDAIGYFEQALGHPNQPLTPDMRQHMESLLAQTRLFVSRAEIAIEPRDAEISVDGAPAPRRDAETPLLLDPGTHELVVSASGFESEARRVTAEGGNTIRAHVVLKPLSLPPVVAANTDTVAAPDLTPPAAPATTQSDALGPYIVMGASGVVAVAGGVLLAVAATNKHRVEHPEKNPVWSDYESRYDSGKVLFPLGAVMLGVGLAGVAAGLTWRFWPTRSESAPAVTWLIQPGFVSVSGRM
jgi:hypothetical protein